MDEFLALLFRADNGRNFRGDVRFDQVQGGCARFQPHAETVALTDNFGILQRQIGKRGRDKAVSRLPDRFERVGNAVVFGFRGDKLLEKRKQMRVAVNFRSAFLAENLVEKPFLQRQRQVEQSLRERRFARADRFGVFRFGERLRENG